MSISSHLTARASLLFTCPAAFFVVFAHDVQGGALRFGLPVAMARRGVSPVEMYYIGEGMAEEGWDPVEIGVAVVCVAVILFLVFYIGMNPITFFLSPSHAMDELIRNVEAETELAKRLEAEHLVKLDLAIGTQGPLIPLLSQTLVKQGERGPELAPLLDMLTRDVSAITHASVMTQHDTKQGQIAAAYIQALQAQKERLRRLADLRKKEKRDDEVSAMRAHYGAEESHHIVISLLLATHDAPQLPSLEQLSSAQLHQALGRLLSLSTSAGLVHTSLAILPNRGEELRSSHMHRLFPRLFPVLSPPAQAPVMPGFGPPSPFGRS